MIITAGEAHLVKRLAEGDLLFGKVDILCAARTNARHLVAAAVFKLGAN